MAQKHLIHRQVYEITADSHRGAAAVQAKLSALHHRLLSKLLFEAFEEVAPANQHLQIDRLVVDLGNLKSDNWEEQTALDLKKLLQKEIRNASAERAKKPSLDAAFLNKSDGEAGPVNFGTEEEKKEELLFYFMLHGRLPWWWTANEKPDLKAIFNALLKNKKQPAVERFREALAVAPRQSTSRLVEHFTRSEIRKLISTLFLEESDQTKSLFKVAESVLLVVKKQLAIGGKMRVFHKELLLLLSKVSPKHKIRIKEFAGEFLPQAVLVALNTGAGASKLSEIDFEQVGHPIKGKEAQDFIAALRQLLRSPKSSKASGTDRNAGLVTTSADEKTAIPVSNAGMLLLYPYLKQFFSEEALLNAEKQFAGDEAKLRAMHLLQYLCTGTKAEAEYELTLNKLLCGWPADEPVPMEFKITKATEERTSELLQSAIKNWSALKSTSQAGLRYAFLQREGLLYAENEKTLIRIERQTHDILLDRLPYTLSMIKLPWLQHIIHVEW